MAMANESDLLQRLGPVRALGAAGDAAKLRRFGRDDHDIGDVAAVRGHHRRAGILCSGGRRQRKTHDRRRLRRRGALHHPPRADQREEEERQGKGTRQREGAEPHTEGRRGKEG